MKFGIKSVLGLGLGLLVTGSASADPLVFDGLEIKANYSTSNAQSVHAVVTGVNDYTGSTDLFTWTRDINYTKDNDWGGSGDTLTPKRSGGTFNTFCIQLNEYVGNGVFTASVLSSAPTLAGTATDKAYRAALIQALWARHIADVSTGTAAQRDAATSAFQIAVWEIVYETKTNGSGNFDLNTANGVATFGGGGNTTDANTWLGQAYNDVYVNPGAATFANVWAMVGPQDQIFLTDARADVPLPATASGFIVLLSAVGGRRALKRLRRTA